jgi:hypothetical protein
MSRLDYRNGPLFSITATSLNKLQSDKNTAARLVTRSARRDHISPILISLYWVPVVFRIQYKILLNTFKALNGLSPVYIQDLVRTYNPTRSLRSEDLCLLVKPSMCTKMYAVIGVSMLRHRPYRTMYSKSSVQNRPSMFLKET